MLVYGGGGAWCRLWDHSKRVCELGRRFESVIVLPSTYERRFEMERTTFHARDRFESRERMSDASFCHDMAFAIGPLEYPKGSGDGRFFRLDKEASGRVDIPPDNRDISMEGNQHTPVERLFEAIARNAVVHTDRLHVAIAGCLLGREVHLHASSYFKIPAVYRSSMEGRFPGVYLHD